MEDALVMALEKVQRQERGQILATLIGWCGDFDLAEEALQDALLAAMQHWGRRGIPVKPGAWLTTVARRKAVDHLRQTGAAPADATVPKAVEATEDPDEIEDADEVHAEADDYPDERLKLIFTCCHPALPPEQGIALTLTTLGGLTTAETAAAFLVPLSTMAQRLVRAKRKIKDAGLPYRIPPPELLAERLESVLTVLYLIFTEGYSATAGESVMRPHLCEEAIRLGRLLELLVRGDSTGIDLTAAAQAEILGLLSLMILIHARRHARVGGGGELIGLENQSRDHWEKREITEGMAVLEAAMHLGCAGPYQLQAAIQALHCGVEAPEMTDWTRIAGLYQSLLEFSDTSVIRLNHAVAVAMAGAPEEGLALLEAWCGELQAYGPFHLARAELLRRMGRRSEALAAYDRALEVTGNARERDFILGRMDA